ncbi:MAG: DNA gyrase/topoisomerase IV subunit A [Bacteroidetes bacterium]|nr:DNA gyrase/topoisomerase IV subunit A [Bacteroidota bacterium]
MAQQNGMNQHVDGMYKEWFLDYASYVILERAVPLIEDGLKPVQRRILHTMFTMEDGRYNKVANVIGSTMKYHPHGDASIGDAMVQLGQKDFLIDKQGNWGNIYTGDSAAASRYIEARLTKFALEVVFNEKVTSWQPSYDGRNKEPIQFPVKFPLLLALGVEGIAVGLACKILPHNFIELCESSIDYLRGKSFTLLPDFATAGVADFRNYNDGLRGGKVKVRAVIEKGQKKTLIIRQIPFGTTTTSITESILAANDKGKIKIKKVEDITSESVEIVVHLHPDTADDSDNAINALYAFTDCEVSISPNSCVIRDGKPVFLGVTEMLKAATDNTVAILKAELEFERHRLSEDWHFSSLEKIFIEKRIYRNIEECETWEAVIAAIDKGLKPYKKLFLREITQDDIVRLTEIKIKRISKFDSFKADEKIKSIEEQLAEIDKHLKNLKGYTIDWYKMLIKKYGKGRERKTVITEGLETIEAKKVVINNSKLYVNREDGFAGYGLKKDELIADCSDLDDVIAINREGKLMVSRIDEKKYFGKEILHIDIFNKDENEKIYNIVYQDGKAGAIMVKRFRMGGITRDKMYDLTKGSEGSKILFMSVSGENNAETVQINLRPKPKMKNTTIMLNLNDTIVKGRDSMGNIVTKASITKIFVSVSSEKATKINAAAGLKEIKLPSQQAGPKNKEQKQLDINFKELLN